MVGELIESTNTHSIFEGNTSSVKPIIGGEEEAENGKGTGTIIMIEQNPSENPNANAMMENGEFESSPNEIVLGHELIHSSHHDQGIVDKTREIDGDNYPPEKPGNHEPLMNEEINTRNKENILRKEQGYVNRRRVSVPFSPEEIQGIEIRMQRN
ncbi:MAG: hypothetical protein JXR58_02920 [Bacteroidales bacterium]|nr:hypothetical protein [Bacteroidales bacterium]